MHTLSMIDARSKAYEAIAPVKAAQPKRESFGKVFNEKHDSGAARAAKSEPSERAERPERSERAEPAQRTEPTDRAEKAPAGKEVAQQPEQKQPAGNAAEQKSSPERSAEKPKVQQLVVSLLKTIAGGETAESTEEFGSVEEILTQLVEQLEGSDLHGEQVLAGVDLSALVEQLQAITSGDGGEEQLAQLVTQLEEQLSSDSGLLANAELVATAMPLADPQTTSQNMVENLAHARQVLQRALDTVARQNPAAEQQVVVTEDESTEQKLLPEDAAAEKIDPRFAGLLKPREVNSESLRERVQANHAKPAVAPPQAANAEIAPTEVAVSPEQAVEDMAELLGAKPQQQRMENLLQQVQSNTQQQVQPTVSGRTVPTTPVQLPSGQQVAESQIFDQVVTRMSGSFNGESGKMVLRLQPAELGSLKLELIVEGDKVRASLLAQTQQVQEVLERNLPQLRSALAEQGLKIDQFLVEVDQRQGQQGQFEQQAQQQKQDKPQQPAWQQNWQNEEQIVPLAHLMQNGGGGISLHV